MTRAATGGKWRRVYQAAATPAVLAGMHVPSLSLSLSLPPPPPLRPGLLPRAHRRLASDCLKRMRPRACPLALLLSCPLTHLLVCPRPLPLALAHSLHPNLSHSPRPISRFRIARLAHTPAHDPRTGPAGRVYMQLRCCTSAQAREGSLILWRLSQPLRDLALPHWSARTLREQQRGARHRGASMHRWHAEDCRGVHCVSAAAATQRRPRQTLAKI